MKAKSARVPTKSLPELLVELQEAMEQRDYSEVDQLLSDHPKLIRKRDGHCEEPLIMAIRQWNPKLVSICMKHGSSPSDHHQCSKDSKPKNAYLVLADELLTRIKKYQSGSKTFDRCFEIHTAIIKEMDTCDPPKKSGE